MTKLTITLAATAVAAAVVATAGWTRTTTIVAQPAAPASAAPADTVTLSRAARIDGVALRMDVAMLRRSGATATLDLRLRSNAPHGGPTFDVDWAFDDEAWVEDLSGVYLMDPATGRKLVPREDSDGDCICSRNLDEVDIRPGGTAMLTATFPAPSPGTTTADVIVPHFGAFRDVPLR